MSTAIVTLTAPSGSGKTHFENQLVLAGFRRLVSHTTRQPRAGEGHGIDYHFVDDTGFEAAGGYVERFTFAGHKYGVSWSTMNAAENSGKPLVVVCEPVGRDSYLLFCRQSRGRFIHIPAFLDVPEEVRLSRFLLRAHGELVEKGERALVSLTSRLRKIMREERQWVREAYVPGTYKLILPYNAESLGACVQRVVREVERGTPAAHYGLEKVT